jgi:hypothetical protein
MPSLVSLPRGVLLDALVSHAAPAETGWHRRRARRWRAEPQVGAGRRTCGAGRRSRSLPTAPARLGAPGHAGRGPSARTRRETCGPTSAGARRGTDAREGGPVRPARTDVREEGRKRDRARRRPTTCGRRSAGPAGHGRAVTSLHARSSHRFGNPRRPAPDGRLTNMCGITCGAVAALPQSTFWPSG